MPLKGATISVLKSDLEPINRAIGGLYSKYPINVAGKYLAGKTLLTLQEGVYICSQLKEKGDKNASILILDSDGGGELFVANWLPVFEKRYGTEADVYVLPAWNERKEEGVSEKRMTIKGDEGWKENKMKINEEISVDNPYVTLVHEAGGDAVLPFGYAEVGTSNPKLFITVYYFGEPPPIENLSIEVKGEDGNPIQNATVYVYKGVRLLKKGKTAYDGTVQFALPSGAYGVVVEASGYYRWEGKLNTGAMIHEITLKKVRLVPPIRLPPAQDVLPYVIIAGAIVVAGAVAYMYYKRGAVASEIASKIARRIA